jgi:hypothetical protein
MPIFKDPIQTLTVEIPAGWAYDPLNSSLTSFFFTRWDRPEEMMAVRMRRAVVENSETDEKWVEQIRKEIGEANSLMDIPSGNSRAVAATFTSATGQVQRVAFVRSYPVELIIEMRGVDQKSTDPWVPLIEAVRTAASAANMNTVGDCGPDAFNHCIEAANLAFEKEDLASVISALKEAVQIGALSWLRNLTDPGGNLDIHAPIRVAQLLIQLGRFTDNPYLLRDSEYIVLRAGRTLEESGSTAEADQRLAKELEDTLTSILTDLLGPLDPNSGESHSPVLAIREGGFRATQSAAKAFEAQEFENADRLAGIAADDLLSLICFLRHNWAQAVPEDISAHLASEGITDIEEQKKALQSARESILFSPLNISLQIQFCCALRRQDAKSAAAAASIILSLARLLADADPKDAGIALNLALALIVSSGALALSSQDGEMDDAMRLLDDANRALLSVGDQSRADDGWIRYHAKQIESIMSELDRKLAEAELAGLKQFRSQCLKVSGGYQGAVARLTQS